MFGTGIRKIQLFRYSLRDKDSVIFERVSYSYHRALKIVVVIFVECCIRSVNPLKSMDRAKLNGKLGP